MRNLILIILITNFISCNSKPDSGIDQFEDYIGKTYTNLLDTMLLEFENLIDTPINVNKYEHFINRTASDSMTRLDWLNGSQSAQKLKDKIFKSGIFNDVFLISSEVYYIDNIIIKKYPFIDILTGDSSMIIDSTFILNQSKIRVIQIDGIDSLSNIEQMIVPKDFDINKYIDEHKTTFRYNDYSRFYWGLNYYCTDSVVLEFTRYYEMRDWDQYDLVRLAKGIQEYKPDYDNYFLKRLIVMELFAK